MGWFFVLKSKINHRVGQLIWLAILAVLIICGIWVVRNMGAIWEAIRGYM